MTGVEYGVATALSLALVALALAASRHLYDRQEEKHQRRTKDAIRHHVSNIVDMLEDVYNRAEKAERGDAEAKEADAYFARSARRLETARMCVELLLPGLDYGDKYAIGVRRILEAESWMFDRYRDPTIPRDKRFHLWRSNGRDLEETVRDAVRTATSLGIITPVTIK